MNVRVLTIFFVCMVSLSAFSINQAFGGTSDQAQYAHKLATSKPLLEHPEQSALFSLLVTSAFLGLSTLFVKYVIKNKNGESHDYGLSNIIKTTDGWYSLANLQFLIWTFVISFAFMFIYMFRILNGVFDLYSADLPANILGLMGISAGAAVASKSIGTSKKPKQKDNMADDQPNALEEQKRKSDEDKKSLRSMFYDSGNKITLSRMQMFLWTVMSVMIYVAIFSGLIFNMVTQLSDPANIDERIKLVSALRVPDIDQVLLVLMGISQVSYLGAKMVDKRSPHTECC